MNPAATRPIVSGSRTSAILLSFATLGAVTFWVLAATPYFTTQRDAFGPVPDAYWDRRFLLWGHILGGTLAMFTGPIQLWLGETRRRLPLHRRLGLVYLAGVAITCTAAIGLSLTATFGLIYASGLFFVAVACAIFTTLAYVAIRKRDFTQHREWMIRSYVMIFAFAIFRALDMAMGAMGIGGMTEDGVLLRLGLAAWASWAVPLFITEVCLQYPKIGRPVRVR